MSALPAQAPAVIVGGGIVGCSVAYHLARLGWRDVVLLEAGKLSAGSTHHAAGLVGQLRSSASITQLLGESVALYGSLERETGLATGWKMNGGLRLACSRDRLTELERQAMTARSFGLEMDLLTPAEARDLWPLMDVSDVIGAAYLPTDGQANPSDITQALARGARMAGATLVEDCRVLEVRSDDCRVLSVSTARGSVETPVVVNCAGQWARQLAARNGVSVPLVSVQHQYMITEPIDGVTTRLPTLRDPDRLVYFKEEVGGLVMGGYEHDPIGWAQDGVPEDFHFQLLDSSWDHFEPIVRLALGRVPALEHVGVKQLVNGPESFTPDGNFILGEAPELHGYYVAAGFNAFGIAAGGGAARPIPCGRPSTAPGVLFRPGRIVPETFGFIHGGVLQPGFTDWLSIPSAKESITFRSEITVKTAQTLKIQVIGKPIRLPRGARAQARKADLKWPCPAEPQAYVVSVPVAPSAKPRRLEIEAQPSINCSPRIHGLAIRLDRAEDGSYKTYAWRPVKRSRPAGKFAIRTADGVYLTGDNGNGKPTAATYELGLLPIIGTGGGDTFSLSGMLAGSRLPADGLEVALTIDSRMQEAAQRAIEWGIERFKNDRWAGERKSALVVLDADTGAILAAGNHPVVPVGLHPWDYASFSATYPLRDPSTIIGWEVIDKHNTPGSTFKPVTALALMMDENESFRNRIAPVMRGLDSASMARATGLSYGSSSYVAYQGAKPVPNFGGATIGRYSSPAAARSALPAGRELIQPKPEVLFGLRRAAQFSLNAWFARVALMMEQDRIDAYAEPKSKTMPASASPRRR